MKRRIWSLLFIIGVMALIIGCSSETKGNNAEESPKSGVAEKNPKTDEPEEATVALMIHWGEKDFEKTFNQHVKKALPHITLTYIQASGKEEIEENFAKGFVPDIVMGSDFRMFKELDLLRDQMPLVEKHGLDLGLYDPGIIESLKNASLEGELNALPVFRPGYIMAYNKDIFDAFGVPYPTDNMTWDEVIELGRQLSGERDGQKYHGLWPGRDQLAQVSATIIDPETNEPNILDNKELRIFLERQQTIFNIPENLPEMDSMEDLADFMYNGNNADPIFDYALFPGRDQTNGFTYREAEAGLNFDWVTYPTWGGDYPDYLPNELYNNLFVTSQSENPDAAFEVLAYLMSEEYQKWSVTTGGSTALLNKEIYDEFGKELDHAEVLDDKNTQALFQLQGAPIPKKSHYEGPLYKTLVINAYQRLLEGEDINTVIRVMDEEARNMIKDLAGKE
ncbi:ABC transporter substrate-binding protein [Bacillus sp. FSL K6-3431]|uniref:ABC transporter substrate-binding protein n=1 Tax=Bacillus sp. FSL K6-3431 TaxID=2921500 RepID=UPI0030F4CC37